MEEKRGELKPERLTKHQTPNTKLQKSSKHQTSNRADGVLLKLGVWSFSGAWCLVFGV
jgi:hypothetical protein